MLRSTLTECCGVANQILQTQGKLSRPRNVAVNLILCSQGKQHPDLLIFPDIVVVVAVLIVCC